MKKISSVEAAAKLCYTASGLLIHHGQVLLVLHRKLHSWMGPGGHMEANESPDQAAEREFFEETGLTVKAVDVSASVFASFTFTRTPNMRPLPFVVSQHWVCRDNYEQRQAALAADKPYRPDPLWPKACEQHLNFTYLMKSSDQQQLTFQASEREVAEVKFFTLSEVTQLYQKGQVFDDVYGEIQLAFQLALPARL